MHKRFLMDKSIKVATAGPDIQVHKFFEPITKEWIYFAINPQIAKEVQPKSSKLPSTAVLGFCSLAKIPRWVALETNIMYVNPEARGKGIATILYDSVLKDGVILISGGSHNVKSRRLWMKMVQTPQYVTWAHDLLDLDRFADIAIEDDTFQCSLKIYQDIKKVRRKRREDIRILAYNPRYVNDHTRPKHL